MEKSRNQGPRSELKESVAIPQPAGRMGSRGGAEEEENSPLSEAERQPEEERVTDRVGVRKVDTGHERNKSRPQEERE